VRAQALARVASAQQKRLEGLRADQTDHEEVQLRIHRERAELDSIVQDLRENDSLSQFYGEVEKNLKSKIAPKLAAQMEKLKQLRARRAEVDDLMKGLVARAELQKIQDAEAKARGSMVLGEFARQRGLLALPVAGTVVSEWGRVKDPETGLFIFKKGIEIQSTEPIPSEVRSVAAGRVVFAGPLGDYGRALVLDHGENHYTLTGQLGKTLPAIGTFVRAGELVGYSFPKKSLYFEIRAGRVPVNPLQWIKR
jgi:septal ring factor EnvC (AmiA/AmiB activator)